MEAAPPSYHQATLIDYWTLVAEYLPSRDLCAAALVCSSWHTTFAPYIWGNPASHFGIENDAVYVALARFKRTLHTARLTVRSLTHTLHLPPAHAEIYYGPHSEWLRDALERLPNLQSLIVRGLPFFDYAALQALNLIRAKQRPDYASTPGVTELPASPVSLFQRPSASAPSFALRLLDASRCPNVTSRGLASALSRFEGLLYLDLSFSSPARDVIVLETLRKFGGLQVLKLRGINLKDDGIETLSKSIALRVRSLDVRDNHMTDRGVRTLLDRCFTTDNAAGALLNVQRSPALLSYLGSDMLEIYQGEDFEGYLRNAFTGRFITRLAIEDAPPGGITHLYISGNPITVEGVSGLVRSGMLHVLDVGSVDGNMTKHPVLATGARPGVRMPGMEKLMPILSQHAAGAMSFLRIDHSLITKHSPNWSADEMVPGRVELGDTSLPYNTNQVSELDGTSIQRLAIELPTEGQSPRYELEGDTLPLMVSPATNDTFRISNPAEQHNEARRGSAFAPEVTEEWLSLQSRSHLSPTSAINASMTGRGPVTSNSSAISGTPMSSHGTPVPRYRSYSSMATERQARLNAHVASGNNLHPAMLPHVKTLILTDVPAFSSDKESAHRLILFIKNCAEEASIARSQAKLDYSAPPGRRGEASALRHSAKKIFALKRLVLELGVDPASSSSRPNASPWHHDTTKSMTGDRDSEALWTAAETDFSFFGVAEEVMLPTLEDESGRFACSFPGASEKEVFSSNGNASSSSPPSSAGRAESRPQRQQQQPGESRKVDTIAVVAAFRKERELAHRRGVAASGNPDLETDGFWDGVVQVVRSNAAPRNDEETDYYGNKFPNHYLYR